MSPANERDPLRGVQWLFRQGELVLGPVSAEQLLAKLYAGEVDGKTEISPLGETRWQRLSQIPGLGLHLAKAEAKLRVEAADRFRVAARRKKRRVIFSVVGGLALVGAIAAVPIARYLAVHRPGVQEDALAFADITVDPPKIIAARARDEAEELVDYPFGGEAKGSARGARRSAPASKGSARSGAGKGPVAAKTTTDAEGMQIAVADSSALQSVVASHQRSLYGCFAEQAQRQPGFSAKIPIEFAVGNDGKVTKLWIDHPDFKRGGPLPDCLLRELKKWPFRPYQGSPATIALTFTIGKRRG